MTSSTYRSTPAFEVGVDHTQARVDLASRSPDIDVPGRLTVAPLVLTFQAPNRPPFQMLSYAARFYPRPTTAHRSAERDLWSLPPDALSGDAPSVAAFMRHASAVVYRAANAAVGDSNAWCVMITSPTGDLQHNTASIASAATRYFAPITTLRRSKPVSAALILPKVTAERITNDFGLMAHEALVLAVRSSDDQHTPSFTLWVGNPDA